MKRETADITIIGGGPGGYVAAIKAARLGARVVLVEREELGGTCLNWGCIPTKAFVRSAEVYQLLKDARSFGCKAEGVSVEMARVIKRKDRVVRQLVRGVEFLMNKNEVRVIRGTGSLKDQQTVSVHAEGEEWEVTSKNIIIATGSETTTLELPGIGLDGVIFSREALMMEELPESLVIVGGGIIGMEFAFVFANFGVEVTVIEYFDDLLPNAVDDDICQEIGRAARKKRIKSHTGARVAEIKRGDDGKLTVIFEKGGETGQVTGEKVLMAVGRKPYFRGLGLEKLGVELTEKGRGIKVNNKMQTNLPGIYAIGDVTDKILLAHVASHQGITAVRNIMDEDYEMDYRAVPSAIFTEPEIAVVGIDERTAQNEDLAVKIGKFPFSANGKALTMGERTGFIKLIAAEESGQIIGGAIVGLGATDLIAELTLAVQNGLTAEEIVETIHAHPTTAEVVHEAALAVEGGAIHYG